MDNVSKNNLLRVKQNDPTLRQLHFCDEGRGRFISEVSADYSTLGQYIAGNTKLRKLIFSGGYALPTLDNQDIRSFVTGIKNNSSIHNLTLGGEIIDDGGLMHETLKVYQDKNSLDELTIRNYHEGGEHNIITTLRRCSHLKTVEISRVTFDVHMFEALTEALREHHMIEQLRLIFIHIGNAECKLLAAMLENQSQNSNLYRLGLFDNGINNEGASIIAKGLAGITVLRELYFRGNPINRDLEDSFSNILCNTTSINSTYISNHTLKRLALPDEHLPDIPRRQLASALYLNRYKNKRHVAIKKILYYHPHIDMETLFTMDLEGEERDLKALPYILSWFERVAVAVKDEEWIWEDYEKEMVRLERVENVIREARETYRIKERKLSAVYQFVQAMPLLFVPASHRTLVTVND